MGKKKTRLFNAQLGQMFIASIPATIIAALGLLHSPLLSEPNEQYASSVFTGFLWIVLVVLLVILSFVAFMQLRKIKNIKILLSETEAFKSENAKLLNVVDNLTKIRYELSNELNALRELVESDGSLDDSCQQIIKQLRQLKAQLSKAICNNVFDFVKNKYGHDGCQVNIMQYFESHPDYPDKGKCIQVISGRRNNAYREESKEPKFFSDFESASDDKIPLHIKIFKKKVVFGDKSVLSLPDKIAVSSKFVIDGDREQNVKQYIGVPIFDKDDSVVLLLQVDVDKELLFGVSSDDLDRFAEKSLMPYVTLLDAVYRYERVTKELIEKRGLAA